MIRLLSNFRLDRPSFWLGFIAGSLLWWVLLRLRPVLGRLFSDMRSRIQATRSELQTGVEIRHRNDTLRLAQRMHLAAPLFSLEEVLILPRVMAPPPPVGPPGAATGEDITDWVLPYLPDWPELPAAFGAPTFSLAEALQGGCNLAVIGRPGCGRSVALAHLAIQAARRETESSALADYVPYLVHSAELVLPPRKPEDLLGPLLDVVSLHASALTLPRLPGFMKETFANGRALLLLDGLDEVAPATQEEILAYLGSLLAKYPRLRMVTTSGLHYGGLAGLGFTPVSLAAWNETQRSAFLQRWSELWTKFIAHPPVAGEETTDPMLLSGWLHNATSGFTPLELTLKLWSVYAGDARGPGPLAALEAHILRFSASLPEACQALEQLAVQMAFTLQPAPARKEAEKWAAGLASLAPAPPGPDVPEATEATPAGAQTAATPEGVASGRIISTLLERGFLVNRPGGRVAFAHPVFSAYLAGRSLAASPAGARLLGQPEWQGKDLTLQYMAAHDLAAGWVAALVEDESIDLLRSGVLQVARWLPSAPENAPWRAQVLRRLVADLQKDTLSLGIRARCLAALVTSGSSGIAVLLRQSLSASQPALRQLAALGCGYIRETKATPEIAKLLADPLHQVRQAACLALVAIGDKAALEAVATGLVQGDESLRRAAAEALANHPEEGHPTLQEGSTVDDLLLRRSVVYGLVRIRAPWAVDILQKMRLEDSQWVVQNAASQALELQSEANPRIPRPLPPVTDTPWLLAFAAKRGVGVVPGKPALELLVAALKDGEDDERMAAIEYFSRCASETAVLPLYQLYFSTQGELREAALSALWLMAAAGIPLPPPVQYGLK